MVTGLTVSTGLSFGVGLILNTVTNESVLTLAATGSLSVNTIQFGTDSATLPGAGSLTASMMQTFKTNPATFGGTGSILTTGTPQGAETLAGTGGLTATAIALSQVQFNGGGGLSQTTLFGAIAANVGFAGSGGGV